MTPNQTIICHTNTSSFKLQLCVHDGNWTEGSPILSVIIGVKANSEDHQGGVHLLIISMITDRIGWQEVLLPINHNHYNVKKKKQKQNTSRTNISNGDNVLGKKFLHSGNFPFFSERSSCCWGYCDQFCDWWIWLKGHSMICCFSCLISYTGVQLQPTVPLHCLITTEQND